MGGYKFVEFVLLSIEANSVDPEQTAPIGAVYSGSTLFAIEASKTFQQKNKAEDFCCDWRFKGQNRKRKMFGILEHVL